MGGDRGDGLTHIDEAGRAVMVDVSEKAATRRTACASGRIRMSEEAARAMDDSAAAKGDVLAVARVAGIMAVKRVPGLIPLCHYTSVSSAGIEFTRTAGALDCTCTVIGVDRTGFEMEALTGVSVALLTVYDMLKAIDRSMIISDVRLLSKSGGRSGEYRARELDG